MNYEKRVKESLMSSLIDLVQKKNIEEITVIDIIHHCDVSRASFYRYFKDKYELMNWVFQQQLEGILSKYPNLSDWKEVTYYTLLFIYDNRKYFENIVRYKNQNSFIKHVYERTHYYFTIRLQDKLGTKDIPLKLTRSIEFCCAGIVHLLENWLSSGMIESPETITEWMCDFTPSTLLEAIE